MEGDVVIVGSGLTGAVIARTLRDAGKQVLVVERRGHVGGNVHDHFHPSGVRIHTYGPHYFRTNNLKLWQFVQQFGEFYEYRPVVKTFVDGSYESWPIGSRYIEQLVGDSWEPPFKGEPTNFEEASLAMMPRVVYEKFVKGYTEKQWGVPATTLDASLARRFEVRTDDDATFMRHRYQGIPVEGYASLMSRMLSGIRVILNCDYLEHQDDFRARKMLVFTGPIDAFFGHDQGPLAYRGQQRTHRYIPDVEGFELPAGQVNNPDPATGAHIRTLEWKHMMEPGFASRVTGTVLSTETPFSPDTPDRMEYPFPDQRNAALYQNYRTRADGLDNVLICGRLGDYRYYDMDHAIARARWLAKRLLRSWTDL